MRHRVMDWCVPDLALRWGELAGLHRSACPRCFETLMWGHPSDEPMGRTCATCGWVRYWDPIERVLVDAIRQPEWHGSHLVLSVGALD
jgi:hypothetical protein